MTAREKILSCIRVEGACWVWCRAISSNGYGMLWVREKRRRQTAHRASYEAFVGPIPDGLQVLHQCDVRPCVNPLHLFLGTQKDNMADMLAKGRANRPRGERSWAAKLCPESVHLIRNTPGKTSRQLAEELGVGKSTVNAVRARESWAHVA